MQHSVISRLGACMAFCAGLLGEGPAALILRWICLVEMLCRAQGNRARCKWLFFQRMLLGRVRWRMVLPHSLVPRAGNLTPVTPQESLREEQTIILPVSLVSVGSLPSPAFESEASCVFSQRSTLVFYLRCEAWFQILEICLTSACTDPLGEGLTMLWLVPDYPRKMVVGPHSRLEFMENCFTMSYWIVSLPVGFVS